MIKRLTILLIFAICSTAVGQGRWQNENGHPSMRKFDNSEKYLNWKVGKKQDDSVVAVDMIKWAGMPDSTYFRVILASDSWLGVSFIDDVMYLNTDSNQIRVYEKDIGTEVEIIVNKPPANPRWAFSIEYSDNIEFNYQNKISELEGGELEDYLAGLINRPRDVEGSYAIKNINKGGINVDGDGRYRTGKVGHLYRPTAVDATGDTLWLDQLITGTKWELDGIFNLAWWENATYPVTIGPTIGISDVGGSTLNLTPYAIGMKNGWGQYTASTGDVVDSGYFYGSALGVSVDIAPYTVTGAAQLPNTIVGTQATISISTTPAWYSVDMNTALSNGVAYTACVGEWSGQTNTYYDSSSPNQYLSRDTQDPSDLPATWSENNQRQYDCSLHMKVESAAGEDEDMSRRSIIIKGM